jgi:hypothetical protein
MQETFEDMPSWKRQLVSNADEARAFFETEFRQRQFCDRIVWDIHSDEYGGSFDIAALKTNPVTGEEDTVFGTNGYIDILNRTLVIKHFGVSVIPFNMVKRNDPYRDHKLSLIGMKSALGISFGACPDLDYIQLDDVSYDGTSFWASLAGFPTYGTLSREPETFLFSRMLLGGLAYWKIDQMAYDTEDQRLLDLLDIGTLSKTYPAVAYQQLATLPLCKNEKDRIGQTINSVRKVTLKTSCPGDKKAMAIDLKDPSSLAILRDKMGALPFCPAPISFHQVAVEAARHRDDQVFLRRYGHYHEREFGMAPIFA